MLTSALLLLCLLIIGAGWLAWQAGVLRFDTPEACVDVGHVVPGENKPELELCLSDDE